MILFVETNFLVGAAFGQDTHADELLDTRRSDLQLLMPSVCVMEALSRLESERKLRGQFRQSLDQQADDIRRRRNSESATALLGHITAAIAENDSLLQDVENRFRRMFARLTDAVSQERVTLVELTPAVAAEWLRPVAALDPADLLILRVIENVARTLEFRQSRAIPKALLTGDKAFHAPEVRELLLACGITQFFRDTQSFLGWYRSVHPGGL